MDLTSVQVHEPSLEEIFSATTAGMRRDRPWSRRADRQAPSPAPAAFGALLALDLRLVGGERHSPDRIGRRADRCRRSWQDAVTFAVSPEDVEGLEVLAGTRRSGCCSVCHAGSTSWRLHGLAHRNLCRRRRRGLGAGYSDSADPRASRMPARAWPTLVGRLQLPLCPAGPPARRLDRDHVLSGSGALLSGHGNLCAGGRGAAILPRARSWSGSVRRGRCCRRPAPGRATDRDWDWPPGRSFSGSFS